jgi:hypothetical protein
MNVENEHCPKEIPLELEFYDPAEAAALMRCTESWLREGAVSGRFPHACWGKGKIVFTSEHILEIARLSEILPCKKDQAVPSSARPALQERLIGTRARARLAPVQ